MYHNSFCFLQCFLSRESLFFQVFVSLHCDYTDLFGDSCSCGRLIACNHDDLDTCRLALFDCIRHCLFRGIHKWNQTDKDEVLHWEVEIVRRWSHKLVVLMVDFFVKRKHSEAKNSLSIFTEPQVDCLEFFLFLCIDLLVFTFKQCSTTVFPNFLGSTFDVSNIMVVRTFLADDWEGVLVSWVERHFGLRSIFAFTERVKVSSLSDLFDWLIEFDQSSLRCVSYDRCIRIFESWLSFFLLRNIELGFRADHCSVMQNFEWRVIYIIFVLKIRTFDLFTVCAQNLSVSPNILDCHFVLSECSCFVRTDTRSRT